MNQPTQMIRQWDLVLFPARLMVSWRVDLRTCRITQLRHYRFQTANWAVQLQPWHPTTAHSPSEWGLSGEEPRWWQVQYNMRITMETVGNNIPFPSVRGSLSLKLWTGWWIFPSHTLWQSNIATENGPCCSMICLKKWPGFHSYVERPEGMSWWVVLIWQTFNDQIWAGAFLQWGIQE